MGSVWKIKITQHEMLRNWDEMLASASVWKCKFTRHERSVNGLRVENQNDQHTRRGQMWSVCQTELNQKEWRGECAL